MKEDKAIIVASSDESVEIAETLAKDNDVLVVGVGGRGQQASNYDYALTRAVAMSAMAESMGFGLFSGMNKLFREKQKSKCLLPGCENMTSHNKGYCSAECFKKSKIK